MCLISGIVSLDYKTVTALKLLNLLYPSTSHFTSWCGNKQETLKPLFMYCTCHHTHCVQCFLLSSHVSPSPLLPQVSLPLSIAITYHSSGKWPLHLNFRCHLLYFHHSCFQHCSHMILHHQEWPGRGKREDLYKANRNVDKLEPTLTMKNVNLFSDMLQDWHSSNSKFLLFLRKRTVGSGKPSTSHLMDTSSPTSKQLWELVTDKTSAGTV